MNALLFASCLHIFLAVLSQSKVTGTENKTIQICEGRHRTIRCEGTAVLSILDANYGRKSRFICPTFQFLSNQTTRCGAPNSSSVIMNLCQDETVCTLTSSNSMFGDPCHGVRKYLEVLYECIATDTTTAISSTKTSISYSSIAKLTNKKESLVTSGYTVQISTNGGSISPTPAPTNSTDSPVSSESKVQTSTDGSNISTTPGKTNGTYSTATSGSTIHTSTDGSHTSTTPVLTNSTDSPASSESTVQTSTDGSNISTTPGITNGTYSTPTSGSTVQTSMNGKDTSTTTALTNGTYSPASSDSTVQTSTNGSNTLTTPGLTKRKDSLASSRSTVQTSTDGSSVSPTQGLINRTYYPVRSDPIIQTAANGSHNDSLMTTIQVGVTVTGTIAITDKVTTSALSQTTEKLTNQTDMLTDMGHVTDVIVHPTSGPSSSYLDESSRIAIGSSMAGLIVFGIVSFVVYRLVSIEKKITPAAARRDINDNTRQNSDLRFV